MNDKFKSKMKEKGKTAYAVSKETGIPYTTMNELMNDKININRCSAETVYLLSLYFKCSIGDLMNPVPLIKNVSGKYQGVKYKWKYSPIHNMELHITEDGKDIVIDRGSLFEHEKFYYETTRMTEVIIDCYLQEKEARKLLYD